MTKQLGQGESVYSSLHETYPVAETEAFVAIKEGDATSLAAVFAKYVDIDKDSYLRVQMPGFLTGGVVTFDMVNAALAVKNLNDEQRISLLTVLHANKVSFSNRRRESLPLDTAHSLNRSAVVCQAVEKFSLG